MRLFSGLGLNPVVGKMCALLDLLSPVDALGHSGWPPGKCILFIGFLTAKHVCYHVLGAGFLSRSSSHLLTSYNRLREVYNSPSTGSAQNVCGNLLKMAASQNECL